MGRGKSRFITYRIRILLFLYVIVTTLLLILFAGGSAFGITDLSIALIGFLIYGTVLYSSYRWIYKPYKKNKRILQLFINGYTLNGDSAVIISPEVEGIMAKFKEMMNTNELISVSKKQAQFLALQNQINPHFLYNTLEGIRGEALVAGLDSVAEMTEALSTFFRYTISNAEHLVTLEDELTNIENYYIIQQYRFGERLHLSIEIDPEEEAIVLQYRLPKLTLQPIVENAVYHGIEMKIGRGTVRIKVETTSKRLILIISDDGLGMEEDTLEELNRKLNHSSFDYVKPESEERGGIALVNVNRRIQLLFGEEYGLNVYSRRNVGTDVEITLPLIQKE